ncbi:unnamed protein product [Blepharisma stoltei]|uniref:Uncharacterized protein n=1 Tax=Blepharisma stoltei TaxID=1481888 RepID=A0AAU9JW02_9CILI|nr:unnamed protein product [Blepharisma stoltei]
MNGRHKTEVVIFVILVFIAFIARTDYWVSWTLLSIFWGVLCLFDWLFTNEKDFMFEPNFKNWQRITEPRY